VLSAAGTNGCVRGCQSQADNSTMKCAHNRAPTAARLSFLVAAVQGDPYMARHLQSPYRLVQLPSEVHLELPMPFWVHPAEDVQVDIGTRELTMVVDGVLKLQRTYYRDEVQAAKHGSSFKVGTWHGVAANSGCCGSAEAALSSATAPAAGQSCHHFVGLD